MCVVCSLIMCAFVLKPPPNFRSRPMRDDDVSIDVIDVPLMQSYLKQWNAVYTRRNRTEELRHALVWNTNDPRICFGLTRNNRLLAILQGEFVHSFETCTIRAVATEPEEMLGGTLLLKEAMSTGNFTVDWEKLKNQPRWYVALLYLQDASLF